jgi:hypothetical protein
MLHCDEANGYGLRRNAAIKISMWKAATSMVIGRRLPYLSGIASFSISGARYIIDEKLGPASFRQTAMKTD